MQPKIDTSKPHSARMYDYFLGGKDHFAVEWEKAKKVLQSWGTVRTAARSGDPRAAVRGPCPPT